MTTWNDLEPHEFAKIFEDCGLNNITETMVEVLCAVQAKLKEKNCV